MNKVNLLLGICLLLLSGCGVEPVFSNAIKANKAQRKKDQEAKEAQKNAAQEKLALDKKENPENYPDEPSEKLTFSQRMSKRWRKLRGKEEDPTIHQ